MSMEWNREGENERGLVKPPEMMTLNTTSIYIEQKLVGNICLVLETRISIRSHLYQREREGDDNVMEFV